MLEAFGGKRFSSFQSARSAMLKEANATFIHSPFGFPKSGRILNNDTELQRMFDSSDQVPTIPEIKY